MKRAFTLAEVLITLGVIGVVAALTMPSVIANYQKKSTLVKLKKTYNLIANSLKSAEKDYGEPYLWNYGLTPDNCDNNCQSNYFRKYVFAYFGKDVELKFTSPVSDYGAEWGYPFGTAWYRYADITLGSRIIVGLDGNHGCENGSCYTTYGYPWFVIDVNDAKKGPNKFGKDLLGLTFDPQNARLFFYGQYFWGDGKFGNATSSDTIKSNCINGNETYCGAYIIINSWTMPKDYPW